MLMKKSHEQGMGPGSSTKKRRSSGGLGAFLDHAKKDFMEKVGGTPRDPWKVNGLESKNARLRDWLRAFLQDG